MTDITITDTSSISSCPQQHNQSVRDHSSLQNGHASRRSARNYSAPPSASYVRKKISLVSVDSVSVSELILVVPGFASPARLFDFLISRYFDFPSLP